MTILTLCFRDGCPLGLSCLRNRANTTPGFRQSWASFGPPVHGWCEHYILVSAAVLTAAEQASLEADRQFLERL